MGKAKPIVQMQQTSFTANTDFCRPVMSPNLMPPAWRLARGATVQQMLDELRTLEQPLRGRAAKAQAEDYEP